MDRVIETTFVVCSKNEGFVNDDYCGIFDTAEKARRFIEDIFCTSDGDPPGFVECFSRDAEGKPVNCYPVIRRIELEPPHTVDDEEYYAELWKEFEEFFD